MVILLTGDNAYKATEEIQRLEHELGLVAERVDADTLDQAKLADIMKGMSLFAERRLVTVHGVSEYAELWTKAAEWASLVDDTTTLVLRDEKPDKRTKAYKHLVAAAKVIEVVSWSERQSGLAEKWLGTLAKEMEIKLTPRQLRDMIARSLVAGSKSGQRVIDQLMLMRAVESLQGFSEVTDDMIATVMPESTSDAVFDLLALVANGNRELLERRLHEFRGTQDGYQLFALVVSQWTQLVMIALTKDQATLDIHPFVRQKLGELARKFSMQQLREFTHLAATLDTQLKSTNLDPWDALTRLLMGITRDY